MNVLFCAGGTLGHIYPALSIINEYISKRANDTIYFFTTNKSLKYFQDIKHNIHHIYSFDVEGINKNIFKLTKSFIKNIIAYYKIKKLLKELNINIVLGMGGYISGIVIKAAHSLNIKCAVHEQNSVLGKSNKMVLKMIDILFTTYKLDIYHKNQINVGNPRYNETIKYLNLKYKNKRHILITSGTNGSKVINEISIKFLNSSHSLNYFTTLVTGTKYYDDVINKLKKGNHYEIIPFSNEMIKLINNSGIVISRSGSTTISEILALKSIPIFIPSPNVTNNHQYYNAKKIIDDKIGYMIEEKDLSIQNIANVLKDIDINYDKNIYRISNYNLNNNIDLLINKLISLGEKDG